VVPARHAAAGREAVSGIAKTPGGPLNEVVMPTVAEQLRAGREARQLTIHQVAEVTKIRTDHLRALEEGNFDVFSAPVYIRGFTRTYASLLKLDVPQLMAQLDEELARTEKFSEPPNLMAHPATPLDVLMFHLSRVRWPRAVLLLGGVALVAGAVILYGQWRQQRKADPLAGLVPAVYPSPTPEAGETLPLPPPR